MRSPGRPCRSGPGDEFRPPDPLLRLLLAADLTAPARARREVGTWLRGHRWPAEAGDDLVLAISEAVSNSVEHGYGVTSPAAAPRPGTVEVLAEIVHHGGRRAATVTVRDAGTWRPPPATRDHRRHGLPLIRACSADLSVTGTPHGTTLVLRSHPVPT